ncbi:MAG: lysophospholipase [Gammaproteobacteria bacterium SG8_47]|nr:MAG: lysophospholipase [Gammaproteobacteria bacterium SG8_47]
MSLTGIVSLILLIVGAYAAFLLFLYLTQHRLLYYPELPSRMVSITPAAIGLDYEAVTLQTSDGVRLDGWWIPAPALRPPRATVLFLHGNAGNISHRLDSIGLFHNLGLAVLIIDYRGYGRSEGRPSEQGTYLDAAAAWAYLTQQRGLRPGSIIVFGRSLGGAVAAHLAVEHEPGALILESTATSMPDLAAQLYPFLPARWLTRFHYDARRALASIACPVLIVHSRNDEIIPFSHGEGLYASAREPKDFLELRGGHNDGFLATGRRYVAGLDQFIRERVGR